MRPIELTLSAFGSYKGTEHIDFTQLGDRGVFLISGKTGAGKSTIFDAISFALFGKPSGDLRKEEMFRSEFADPKTRTYVKLRFAYGGKDNLVKRHHRDALANALKENGVPHVEVDFPNSHHGMWSDPDKTDEFRKAVLLYCNAYMGK